MKAPQLVLAVIFALGALRPAYAATFDPLQPFFLAPDRSTLPMSALGAWALGISGEVRVLVFPHLHSYAPTGRDSVTSRVTLSTDEACSIYPASAAGIGGPLLGTFTNLQLIAASLSNPLWIECPKALKIERSGKVPSFRYSGSFRISAITHSGRKMVQIVNYLSMENYLRGVVPSEMPSYWPLEALRAQAVAARTYAWFQVGGARFLGLARDYDLDDTVLYQAYTGVTNETSRTDQAVDLTAGHVLTYADRLIQAFFGADSGGYTESSENVWPKIGVLPYCRGKPEVYTDADIDLHRWGPWTVTVDWSTLSRKLQSSRLIPLGTRVADAWVADTTDSGRASRVGVTLSGGLELAVDGNSFRSALGLKSTLFKQMEKAKKGLKITGRGFGHGVGMSQLGAMTLAHVMGWDFLKILRFYYTDIDVCALPGFAPGDPSVSTCTLR